VTDFGKLLRTFRGQCRNPEKGGRLSQQWLGRLLGDEMGITNISGAAVSYWESGESKIHADDRLLLTSLIKVLKQHGGIKTLEDANLLLETGNYRALNESERQNIFPNESPETSDKTPIHEAEKKAVPIDFPQQPHPIFDFQNLVSDTNEAATPRWSLAAAAIMRRISDQTEGWDFVRLFIWLPVWILAYVSISPSLQWPFPLYETATGAIMLYIYGSFALPLCIGILTNTKDNLVWKNRVEASSVVVRLYTYQGAAVGFHVGYFMIFAFHLIAYYLQIRLPIWFQFLLMTFPLFIGAVGANVVPDNLWRAYKRLSLRDGWIFFVFVLVGPLWGWFFLQYYSWLISPVIGAGIIVIALLLTAMMGRHKRKK
jgi:hypothetical protein